MDDTIFSRLYEFMWDFAVSLVPVLDPYSNFNWVYVVAFLATAYFFYARRPRNTVESREQTFADYIFPQSIYTHADAIVGYKTYVINTLFFRFTSLAWFAFLSVGFADAIENALSYSGAGLQLSGALGAVAVFVFGLAAYLLQDYILFLMHYLSHRMPILWEFHKIHHTLRVLTPVHDFHLHPIELIVRDMFYAVVFGGFLGLVNTLVLKDGLVIRSADIFWLSVLINVFWNFRHTHIPVHYPPWISSILISPAVHQVHHSANPEHHEKNYGLTFSIWDKLAGTYYCPTKQEIIKYGLGDDADADRYTSAINAYFRPFGEVYRLYVLGKPLFGRSPN